MELLTATDCGCADIAAAQPAEGGPLAISRTDFWMSELWLSTWWEAYGGNRELRVLAPEPTRRAGWPLFCERRPAPLNAFRRLALVGNRYCRHALDQPEDIPLLAQHLARQRNWDELLFTSLPAAQAAVWQTALGAAGVQVSLSPPWQQRHIPLARPWTEIEADLRPGLVSNIRKRERALQKLAPLTLRVHTGLDGLDAVFAACLEIEASGWKGASKTAMASRPAQEQFYRSLAGHAAARGGLHLALLYSADTLIAFSFDLLFGRTLAGLKIGYRDTWRKYAPGMVLKYRLLRHLHAAGVEEFDLGGGADPYKADWTPHARTLADLHAFNTTLRGRAAALALRARAALRHRRHLDTPAPAPAPTPDAVPAPAS